MMGPTIPFEGVPAAAGAQDRLLLSMEALLLLVLGPKAGLKLRTKHINLFLPCIVTPAVLLEWACGARSCPPPCCPALSSASLQSSHSNLLHQVPTQQPLPPQRLPPQAPPFLEAATQNREEYKLPPSLLVVQPFQFSPMHAGSCSLPLAGFSASQGKMGLRMQACSKQEEELHPKGAVSVLDSCRKKTCRVANPTSTPHPQLTLGSRAQAETQQGQLHFPWCKCYC